MENLQQEILTRLDALAAKLGVTVDQLFNTMVHETIAKSIAGAIGDGVQVLIGLIAIIISVFMVRKTASMETLIGTAGAYWPFKKVAGCIASIGLAFAFGILFFGGMDSMIDNVRTAMAPTCETMKTISILLR